MAKYVSGATGNWSTAATWDTLSIDTGFSDSSATFVGTEY